MVLFGVGCAGSSGLCERKAFWEDEWKPQRQYAGVLDSVFEFDENDKPTKQEVFYLRVNYLEKYCYQTRIE